MILNHLFFMKTTRFMLTKNYANLSDVITLYIAVAIKNVAKLRTISMLHG